MSTSRSIALAARLFYGDLGLAPASTCCSTRWATPDGRPALRRGAARRISPPHRPSCATSDRDTVEANPMRVLDCKRPECAGGHRGCAPDARPPLRPVPGALRAGASRARRARRSSFTHRHRGWCAGSTTTRARRSSSRPTRSTPPRTRIGGGGRYDGLVEELGGPPTPGIGFGSGIERILLACDAEGVFPAPARRRRRVRRRHRRRRGRAATLTAALRARRDSRRPRVRRPLDEGADEGGRPLGRAELARRSSGADELADGKVNGRSRLDARPAEEPVGHGRRRRPRHEEAGLDERPIDAHRLLRRAAGEPTSGRHGRRCAAGWRAAASTASTWRSSTCATTPASCSASSTAPTTCAPSTSCGSRGTVRARPEGTVNAELPPARSRSATARSRC